MRAISLFYKISLLLVAALVVSACGRPPDPNDPTEVGLMAPEVLQRNLKWASDFINDRVALQEIEDGQGRKMLQAYADKLTESVDIKKLDDPDAWRYGEVFRTAQRWDLAERAFERASPFALKSNNMNRFVNDTLHLAESKAHLGKIDDAIRLARSTFVVGPTEKAPILMAILYEIAPPSLNHGKDVELANLLMDAIDQNLQVIVDIRTEPGAAFFAAKGHHMRLAWEQVFAIFNKANRPDLLKQAQDRKFRTSNRGV